MNAHDQTTSLNDEQDIIRIIIHRVPWANDFKERPSNKLKWRVVFDGQELIKSTPTAYEDAATLLFTRGEDPERLFTMRHADLAYDSFVPIKLKHAARKGLKRKEAGEKFKQYIAERFGKAAPDEEPEDPEAPGT